MIERSGQLNRKIELWRKTVTKNEFGEYVTDWQLHSYVRAYVHNHYGNQDLENNEVFDSIKIRITTRRQIDVTEMDRFKINGDMYDITFIQPDDTYRWNHIRCLRINE
jgi:SPP1 family predicted phage head-tail adaptor